MKKPDIREIKGVFQEYFSSSAEFFQKKYKRQEAMADIEDFSDYPERVMENAKAMFVLSTGRCGTDFVNHLLQQSDTLYVKHEATPKLPVASRYLYENSLIKTKGANAAFLAARYHLIQDAYMFKKRYVETNNRLTFFASAIGNLMPGAQFIHIIRHPGAFVRSGMRRGYYTDEFISDYGKIRPIERDDAFEQWETYSRIEKISWLWYRTNKLIENFKETYSGKVLMLQSDDLFNQTDSTIGRMMDFMGEPAIKNIKTDLGPKNKQRSGEFPRYNDWKDEDKEKLKRIVGGLAQEYGYEV